jgi:hypothetical protein
MDPQPGDAIAEAFLSLAGWSWMFTALAVILMTLPFLRYITLGWRLKLEAITNEFDPPAIALYFRKYRTGEMTGDRQRRLISLQPGTDNKKLVAEFLRLYCREFGRIRYIVPLVILIVVTAIESVGAIQSGLFHTRQEDLFFQLCGMDKRALCAAPAYAVEQAKLYDQLVWKALLLNATTVAGLTGAYMWVVQDAITRMRSGDLLSSNIYWSALRMVIAAPLGIAVASVASDSAGPFVAFAIGAFPIDQISRFLRTMAAKQLGVTNDPDTDGDEVKKLIGVNNDIAQRLISENTSSVLELAKADPVWLTMRTNLQLEVVAELIDQAIVWLSFASARPEETASKVEKLRASNLGSATLVADFVDILTRRVPDDASPVDSALIEHQRENAEAMLTITAAILIFNECDHPTAYDREQLRRVLTSIARDDGTKFLVKLKALSPW